jgi:hypothetical protein
VGWWITLCSSQSSKRGFKWKTINIWNQEVLKCS